jgi:predicted Zn finger-like uncharacterized protein
MEETSQQAPENRIRISCPHCGANFRVDPAAVPPEGATAVCKRCARRFAVPGSGTGHGPERAVSPPSENESSFTCPKCGHRQPQPFTCYACGASMMPKEASVPAVEVEPSRGNPLSVPGFGEIVVRARFKPSDWWMHFARPRVTIDGMDYQMEWGVRSFEVPEGDCMVTADSRIMTRSVGRGTMTVRVTSSEKMYLDYYPQAQSGGLPGALRKASLAEGLLWRSLVKSVRPEGKGKFSRKAVIISLLVAGPLGLIPLWRSDAFSRTVKIAITAAMGLATYWMISKLSIPKGSSLMQYRMP